MIIGSGMIASCLKSSDLKHDDLIIVACGVPNSQEARMSEYERELESLTDLQQFYLGTDKKLIYFSSTSVNESSYSYYPTHKLNVERFIEKNFENHLIIRLPILVGANNENQLLGFLSKKLKNDEPVNITLNQNKHLIDVNDLPKIIQILVKTTFKKINVAFDNQISVVGIVDILETIFKKRFFSKCFDDSRKESVVIDNSDFINLIGKEENNFNTNPEKIISKHYS